MKLAKVSLHISLLAGEAVTREEPPLPILNHISKLTLKANYTRRGCRKRPNAWSHSSSITCHLNKVIETHTPSLIALCPTHTHTIHARTNTLSENENHKYCHLVVNDISKKCVFLGSGFIKEFSKRQKPK